MTVNGLGSLFIRISSAVKGTAFLLLCMRIPLCVSRQFNKIAPHQRKIFFHIPQILF